MDNYHAESCHFLMKLRQSFSYMGFASEAGFKKKHYFQGQQSYDNNRSYVRSLMDAGFVPFTGADEDNFIDVVDRDHTYYFLISSISLMVTTNTKRNDETQKSVTRNQQNYLLMHPHQHLARSTLTFLPSEVHPHEYNYNELMSTGTDFISTINYESPVFLQTSPTFCGFHTYSHPPNL